MDYNNIKENSGADRRFKTLLFVLSMAGVPLKDGGISPKALLMYNIILIYSYYVQLLCVFLGIVFDAEDLAETTRYIRMFVSAVLMCWIHIMLWCYKKKLRFLIQLTESFIWEELPIRDPDTGYLTMRGYIPIVEKCTKYAVLFMISFQTCHSLPRMVKNRELIFYAWYPFDYKVSPIYELIIIQQVFTLLFVATVFTSFQSLYATLVCVACSQLEKLRFRFMEIGQKNVTSRSGPFANTETAHERKEKQIPEEMLNQMHKKLIGCIKEHQLTLRFMDEMEETLHVPLCGIFTILMICVCVCAFSIVTSWGDLSDVAQATVMYIMMMINVLVFCWLGTQLTTLAESVKDMAWECEWIGTSLSFQRDLKFVIAMANKEFVLTAGKAVPVCNETMMNMLNQSMSFFMFLLHVKGKIEEPTDVE